MIHRPLYRWKSFWLGLLVIVSNAGERSLQAFRDGESVLIPIEGEKFLRVQIDGSGHVEDIETPVAAGDGAHFRDPLAGDEDVGHVDLHDGDETIANVVAEVGEHFLGFADRIADLRVLTVPECLEADGLTELPDQQPGHVQRSRHSRAASQGAL